MKLHHLRDFVAIAETRSIRGASRSLGLTQPALTRSLRELEAELGTPLLERHARGVVPTAIGEAFLRRAHAAMEEIRRAREEVEQLQGRQTGTVAMGLSGATWLALVPEVFPSFRRSHPGVRLHMVEGFFPALESRLADGTLDFYIGPRPERIDTDRYSVDLLFENGRLVAGRKGHPRRHARRLADLIDAEWILTGARQPLEAEFADAFARHGLPPPVAMVQAESMIGVAALLSMTDALTLLPRQWVDSPLLCGMVEVIPIAERIDSADIVRIARAGLPLTPAAAHLSTLFERAAAHYVKAHNG
ncbi:MULTISPECIES: LysR substrate-binding domain-containing protein [unclassified Cupriavidus]|uniref:LysR substrate-binding domain-containing protein n=1 Tax=unclassified Cupriavidus TaxID=2640874 RepID=UPI001BFFEDD9|nr:MULTISPECIES: LysR substrate-binding domain-containing protein [unclassified Cupriavidus]MCA3191946.1 LysR family transcriptional regulator [Cupriavidus sp.]MCA3197691.1 LysR family transcriptional regulator [Cupriavidus sp.]MCA3202743.1 LysR family transcriptional regulator [Cupriavidus sp.]MCA3210052.1 LysR family transcriptional regulator [Cupriavidus sp.]QWE96950.1 LysR family transcriptional regulator [Cupriavidus sp. EM10]